jgi:hypothetical protein
MIGAASLVKNVSYQPPNGMSPESVLTNRLPRSSKV